MNAERAALLRKWTCGLPEADDLWAELESDYGTEAELLECAVFTAFARKVVEWQRSGDSEQVALALLNTEELLRNAEWAADENLRGLLSVCFLESIQNLALNGYADYGALEAGLGSRTRLCWEEIEQLWEGDAMVAPHLLDMISRSLGLVGAGAGFQSLVGAPFRALGMFGEWLGKGRR
jgi:hypothetical protein